MPSTRSRWFSGVSKLSAKNRLRCRSRQSDVLVERFHGASHRFGIAMGDGFAAKRQSDDPLATDAANFEGTLGVGRRGDGHADQTRFDVARGFLPSCVPKLARFDSGEPRGEVLILGCLRLADFYGDAGERLPFEVDDAAANGQVFDEFERDGLLLDFDIFVFHPGRTVAI